MENLKDKIFDLFYIKPLQVKDIAKSEKVSSAYVTKVVKTDLWIGYNKLDKKDKDMLK